LSDYQHIHPDFRHIMRLSDVERCRFMDEQRFIRYPTANRIIDHLQDLLNKPQRPRMPSMLMVGESNNGKTTIIRRFMELCGNGYIDSKVEPVLPVILAEAPPTADEKSLYLSIMQQFFAPHRSTDPVSRLRYQVLDMFRSHHVKMLIIDEFHSLLTGSAVKQREVMNAIKFLCNELAIPIVGVGTREAVRVLHTDPQHASRFEVISLPLWELNREFQQILANIELLLPLKNPSKLHVAESAAILHSISEGNLGNLIRLLTECTSFAIKNGEETISKSIIEQHAWVRPTHGIRERVG